MEWAIISMWNDNVLARGLSDKISEEGLSKITKYLKSQQIRGSARKVGNNEVQVTTWWKKYSNEHTPKTDIVIGKHRISLKTGRAQLMSGSLQGDTKATFMAAVERSKEKTELISEVLSMIDKMPKTILSEVDPVSNETIKNDVIEKVERMNKKLNIKMKKLFENNENIKMKFVEEAMTGRKKFGEDSIGFADSVLYCEPNGLAILHKTSDKSYIKKVASKTNLNISFKSNTIKKMVDGEFVQSGRKSYSVARLAVGIVDQIKRSKLNDSVMLDENIIMDIWNKIKEWMISFINEVKEWIGDSFEKLLEFLGLLDDEDGIIVNVYGNVDFS